MGGVVALSSRVSATLGWRRQHHTPSQGGYSLWWLVSRTAQALDYAPEMKPDARGGAQAKAKGSVESCASCDLVGGHCRRSRHGKQLVVSRWSVHLNVGAPTERPVADASSLVRQSASRCNSPARGR